MVGDKTWRDLIGLLYAAVRSKEAESDKKQTSSEVGHETHSR